MSQQPNTTVSSAGLDFTPTIHHDTYPLISPSKTTHATRRVLITGASKGIGRATALSFARAGCGSLALAARTSLSSLCAEIRAAAASANVPAPALLCLKLDVTSKESCGEAAEAVEREFGGLDVLINNAGYLEKFARVADSEPDEWWRTWEVNVKGPYLVTRAFLPLLLRGGDKTVVNLSSVGAHFLFPGASAYQSTKLALLRFTEFVAADYKDEGVCAYCIHPGGVETELALGMPEGMHHVLIDEVALAADTLCWLAQEKREWLNGRYVSSTWDMGELLEKREEIEKNDLLKIRMAVVA
ncbi:NAD-P-binding protein [Saccharata proteae CBS 121410]|uniref:NAD-P-binding protein n=1 Tax=Saccharata proteae CBS 121410 TaxID=1314787 RepID=A0A9P4HYC2_9PEZI|nr:NAD-P-binding protein [Saccharata proteae CBS 121410]